MSDDDYPDPQDEVEETLRRFGDFVKKTFRESDSGDRLVAWLTIILITVTTVTAVIYWRQLIQTRRSADAATSAANTAASQLELSERPWVDAEIEKVGPLTWNVNGASLPLKFIVKNSGSSPALQVFVNPAITIRLGGRDVEGLRDQLCAQASQMKNGFFSIFPNRTIPMEIDMGISREQIKTAIGKSPTFKGAFVSPVVVACIGYRPSFSASSFYSTSYTLDVLRIDDRTGQPLATFFPDETVSQDHLSLRLSLINPVQAR